MRNRGAAEESKGNQMKPTRAGALLGDLRQLIVEARQDVAQQANTALVLLYWRVDTPIRGRYGGTSWI